MTFFIIWIFMLKNVLILISCFALGDTLTNQLMLDHDEHGFVLDFSITLLGKRK